jgi:hypothetical protein
MVAMMASGSGAVVNAIGVIRLASSVGSVERWFSRALVQSSVGSVVEIRNVISVLRFMVRSISGTCCHD